ncbi:HsdR family type I site-specific deoxyribonuclease, partial [Gammaproteobacteria bacterium]|nr:HsdR family type I site-specific deoxyribonuclease [Gammaproteobacteria bacterium]
MRKQFDVNSMLKGLHGKLGDEDYIEPLEILINSLNKHNKFNRFGTIAFNHQLKNRLKMRKMLNELHLNNNFDEPADPVFVIGLPRSGTSLLFNLLSLDIAHRSPMYWEIMHLMPLTKTKAARQRREFKTNAELKLAKTIIPKLRAIHTIRASTPEECQQIATMNIRSFVYMCMADIPEYIEYLKNTSFDSVFRWHKRFYQALELNGKPTRWLLKDPSHIGHIPQILKEYPNAKFIHIHRDPIESVGSFCSLTKNVRLAFSKKISTHGTEWQYQSPDQLDRDVNEVLIESQVKAALIRLNPEISADPELADEVIYKLRTILISVNQVGLVKANEEFVLWLTGEKTMPFGDNNEHISVRLIDFENISNNQYVITNQYRIHNRETKIPDVIMMINGIPVVVGEAKTPIRPSVSWLDGANEVHNIYENAVPQLFVPNILSFATEGKELFYGSIRCPLEFWSPWRLENDDEKIAKSIGLGEVGKELKDLLSQERLLDILRNFSLFSTDSKKRLIKIIPRFQQYEGANKIVERVIEGRIKKGLIWHFQGSGKSLLMVFAAQKLRREPALKSPTVIVLVDRTDLDTQISGIFNASDVTNVETTESIKELQLMLEQGTRKIIISMIHKFRDAKPNMNNRDNIIVLVDEAHRTQEGELGRQMRAALPNAFLFGLTGTPVNKADKNTFWAFGSNEDEGGYMSRYTFQDSIRDEATLPLHFEPRLIDVHVDRSELDKAFADFKEIKGLTDEEADALNKKSAKMAAFLKAPERVEKIVLDISEHYKEKVLPHGFKAMIVTPDRHACVQYKEELDKYFPKEASEVVISTTANDDFEFKKNWGIDKSQQEKIVDEFNDNSSNLKFLIVTAKLLTGFDAPILQTMYLDKSIKDHTLLQAICRTNRLYPSKTFGRIVDYFGLFDDAAQALEFDEEGLSQVITNLTELRNKLPAAMDSALQHFHGVDRSITGFEGLEQAQEAINNDKKKDAFAADFTHLTKLWESLSPDNILELYDSDYKWLAQVYESVRPTSDNIGKLLWLTLGAQTT